MKNFVRLSAWALLLLGTTACGEDLFCIDQLESVFITVKGDPLDDVYTIRKATGDTLRFYQFPGDGDARIYTVMTDSLRPQLEKRTETFVFQGLSAGEIVVNEPFDITADRCHIQYVSGVQEVTW